MIKLMGDLIGANDRVERVIAFGEAIPKLERLRIIVFVGLAGVCFVLAVAYISMSSQIESLRAKQASISQQSAILERLEKADIERDVILRALVGKSGARGASTD